MQEIAKNQNMGECLLNLQENLEGAIYVPAEELYFVLEIKEPFAKWLEGMSEYGFEEGQDYACLVSQEGKVLDYHLTLDAAQEIAAMQKTAQGREVRQFLVNKKKLLQKAQSEYVLELDAFHERTLQETQCNGALELDAFHERVHDFFSNARSNYEAIGFHALSLFESMLGEAIKVAQQTGYMHPQMSADYQNICELRELMHLFCNLPARA